MLRAPGQYDISKSVPIYLNSTKTSFNYQRSMIILNKYTSIRINNKLLFIRNVGNIEM